MYENNAYQNVKHLVNLVKEFLSGPDRSVALAGQIETLLDEIFPEDSEMQDLVISLASYRPEGGPHLYDQAEMISLLRAALPVIERTLSKKSD